MLAVCLLRVVFVSCVTLDVAKKAFPSFRSFLFRPCSSLNSSLNNVASTIYTSSNVNPSNLVEQLNHHLTSSNNWRTTNTTNNNLSNINTLHNNVSSSSSSRTQQQPSATTLTLTTSATGSTLKRKSGAERLFSYFEADDSDDIELDYAR